MEDCQRGHHGQLVTSLAAGDLKRVHGCVTTQYLKTEERIALVLHLKGNYVMKTSVQLMEVYHYGLGGAGVARHVVMEQRPVVEVVQTLHQLMEEKAVRNHLLKQQVVTCANVDAVIHTDSLVAIKDVFLYIQLKEVDVMAGQELVCQDANSCATKMQLQVDVQEENAISWFGIQILALLPAGVNLEIGTAENMEQIVGIIYLHEIAKKLLLHQI